MYKVFVGKNASGKTTILAEVLKQNLQDSKRVSTNLNFVTIVKPTLLS